MVKAVAERPSTRLYTGFEPYDNIYLKAASLTEGIIRWHPFYDGNKRTALLTVQTYLEVNDIIITYPLGAIRYSVEIAKNENNDPRSTELLILEIAAWLKRYSATNQFVVLLKGFLYLLIPIYTMVFLITIGLSEYGGNKIARWMAFDIYPEYSKDFDKVWNFFGDMNSGRYSGILSRHGDSTTEE